MRFAADWLSALTEPELEDTLNWVREREKTYRRAGSFELACWWGTLGHEVIEAMTRLWERDRAAMPEQLYLTPERPADRDIRIGLIEAHLHDGEEQEEQQRVTIDSGPWGWITGPAPEREAAG